MLGVLALLAAAGAGSDATARAVLFRISPKVRNAHPIAADFLGLALEYRSIPQFAGGDLQSINPVLVQLIRNLVPQGRPVLRIGGQSGDRTWWPVAGMSQPLGMTYALTPSWMLSARSLAQATNARLILGLGLEAGRTQLAAVEANQLLQGLGPDYVAALEIGNEPELYTTVPWYRKLHGMPIPWFKHVGKQVFARPPKYGPAAFFREFSRTLAVLPRVPIAGPDTGSFPWLDRFLPLVSRSSRVRVVTWHAYALNQCVTDPASAQFPTVANLLSLPASHGILDGISPYVALAHKAGASFRVDEMNSVTCNGRFGVSDTFASALWVMDALFTIAADGVDGVNVHTHPNIANGLFDFGHASGPWEGTVHPLYYGLMMFVQAAPPGSRVLQVQSASQKEMRAWATLAPDHRVRVLLINDSRRDAALGLVRAPAGPGSASIERLRGPSAYSTGGITLGGQSFGAQTQTGVLGPVQTTLVAPRSGVYAVSLPAASAALLTLPPQAR